MMNQQQLKTQLFVDGYLQGTCLAIATFAFGEAAVFALCHCLLCIIPAVSALALSVLFEKAARRIAANKSLLQILETAATLQIPPPTSARNKNINYVVKYKQRGKYAK